jgi:hypothetical protein
MWKNIVEHGRAQTTIRCTHIACWITKATTTYSEYVLFIFHWCRDFPFGRTDMRKVKVAFRHFAKASKKGRRKEVEETPVIERTGTCLQIFHHVFDSVRFVFLFHILVISSYFSKPTGYFTVPENQYGPQCSLYEKPPPVYTFFLKCMTFEVWSDKLSRNVAMQIQTYAA